MLLNIPLSKNIDHYVEKIDEHIKEDFETKVPDYGAEPFRPKGFHFKRSGSAVKGIYRMKYAKAGGNAFLPASTHINFTGKLSEDSKGEGCFKVFLYPQLTQIFMMVVSLVFIIFFSRNIAETYIYVVVFAVIFLYCLLETVRHTATTIKELKNFFK